jgi:hypothetical protein
LSLNLRVVEEHEPAQDLRQLVETIHPVLSARAGDLDTLETELTVVLTGDLAASVRRLDPSKLNFTPERIGGIVAAKTLDLQRDYSESAVIIGVTRPVPADEQAATWDGMQFLATLAHEYAHVALGRLRASVGMKHPVASTVVSLKRLGQILASQAAEEFRCDMFADSILSNFQISANGSDSSALRLGNLAGKAYATEVAKVLNDHVYPGWPDMVEAYQRGKISLEDMFRKLVSETDQTLKFIAHADAEAVTTGQPGALAKHKDHPAAMFYLGPVWHPVRAKLDECPGIPSLNLFAEAEQAIQVCGERVETMWNHLGVAGRITEEGHLWLEVMSPRSR